MSARYVAVRAQHASDVRTLGGIGSLSCRCYWWATGETAEEALDAAEDDTAVVYDLETGAEVEW